MSGTDSHFAWTPTPEQAGASRLRHFIDSLGAADLDGIARIAHDDPERFWTAVADDIDVEGWAVRKVVHCAPCKLRECPIDHRCMTRVTVEHVVAAATLKGTFHS